MKSGKYPFFGGIIATICRSEAAKKSRIKHAVFRRAYTVAVFFFRKTNSRTKETASLYQ
jgi:hypothetical protein